VAACPGGRVLSLTVTQHLINLHHLNLSGCGATVAHQLPKLRVAGSNPVARSKFSVNSQLPIVLRKTFRNGIRFAHTMFPLGINVWFHCIGRFLTMRKGLLAVFSTLCLVAAVDVAVAQQNQTPENKDKNAAEKTADKAKEAGQQVGDKAEDVKDKTVKGTKTAAKKTKDAAEEAGDKAGDVKDKTVEGAKAAGEKTKDVVQEGGDKAEDIKDKTVKGAKAAGEKTKDVANEAGDKAAKGVKVATKESKELGKEAADKAGDVKDKGEKGAKKTGNWFTRVFKKIF
jgi:hypothetical protein